jgi:Uma2 family endonuclease
MNAVIPSRKLFSVREYEELIATGFFTGKKRVELIEGELIEKMTQGDPHIGCINRLNRIFMRNLGDDFIVSVQNAIVVNPYSAPEPDVVILRFREDFYASGKAKPEDVLLIIEVSDSTVRFDRQTKMPLYARAGIEEAWLVNLPRKALEVYRSPVNGKYQIVQKLGKNESIAPLNFPELQVSVSNIIG